MTKKRGKRGKGPKFTHRKLNRTGGRQIPPKKPFDIVTSEPKGGIEYPVESDSQSCSIFPNTDDATFGECSSTSEVIPESRHFTDPVKTPEERGTVSIVASPDAIHSDIQSTAQQTSGNHLAIFECSSVTQDISEPSHLPESLETPDERLSFDGVPVSAGVHTDIQTADYQISGSQLPIVEASVVEEVCKPDIELVQEVSAELQRLLPSSFLCVPKENGINILLLSRDDHLVTQRRVFSYAGSAVIYVHCRDIPKDISDTILNTFNSACTILSSATKVAFVERVLSVINMLRQYEVCVGIDEVKFKVLWNIDRNGVVDTNPYHETRYSETFRPHTCRLLVDCTKKLKRRCLDCIRVKTNFGHKIVNHLSPEAKPTTANCHLYHNQLINKVEKQQAELQYSRAQIRKLKKELEKCMTRDGIDVDEALSNDLCSALEGAKFSPIEELFVQEQIKLAKAKVPSGHRWHPTILRFALLIKSTSSAAYRAIQDSGVMKLPSERTLFEYSHATPAESGCTTAKLNRLCKQVLDHYPEAYQQWHMTELDEMHINQKLVVVKSTGKIIGYCNLSSAEEELRELIAECSGEKAPDLPVASRILAFLVRGVASSVAEVVASYPTSDSVQSEWLHEKLWEVIGGVEGSGLKVIGVVGDGAAIVRALFFSHVPITKLESGVVFDTVNKCSKNHERPLFFFSDVQHLVKTFRNNLYRSGSGPSFTKLLTRNGEIMTWQSIKRLYEEDKALNLRRNHRLNSYNIHLDSRSIMKVGYATDVICEETALDLETRNWPNTKELVKLIRHGANFYGMLRGAYSTMGKRKADPNLYPYERDDDERFDKLMDILKYFRDWEAEVRGNKRFKRGEQSKMIISEQTLDGIEMTIRSFIAATRYLLKEGVKFINAKVFDQDPLENYFGKQRQSGGGNRNPTVAQFQSNENKIAVHRDMNVRGSNVGGKRKAMEITNEPLPKRPRPQR